MLDVRQPAPTEVPREGEG